MGKLIVIEGSDCSGKETQSKLLVERLKKEGLKAVRLAFPMYETPTGRIVGACVLGKPKMVQDYLKTDGGFFPEGGGNIDGLTALCYFAADRRYNVSLIKKYLDEDYIVILDRYTISNMAHQGGMLKTREERINMYIKIEKLEYEILELPKPDEVIFLHMPYEYICEMKKSRVEELDEAEKNEEYLKNAEKAYIELMDLYHFSSVLCVKDEKIRSISDINDEIYNRLVGE